MLPSTTIRERTRLRKTVFMGLIVGIVLELTVVTSLLGVPTAKVPLDLTLVILSRLFIIPSAVLHLWQRPGYQEIARVPVIDKFLERNWMVILIPVILGLAFLGWDQFLVLAKAGASAFH
jgi:hypothetical protein